MYGGLTYSEAYNIPVWQRTWWLQQTLKKMKSESGQEDHDNPQPLVLSRAPQHNTPDIRAMQGKTPHVSPRMIKLT